MSAIIGGANDEYRYRLERDVKPSGFSVSIIMVNPSTADAINNDPTIKKLIGFGERLGWQKFIVANLFAFRATDVNELKSASDPIGPLNDGHLLSAMLETDLTIVAWGQLAKLPPQLRNRWHIIQKLASAIDRKLYCFGTCNDGHPFHPVMIAYASILRTWELSQ
jgi:hypothetical protein